MEYNKKEKKKRKKNNPIIQEVARRVALVVKSRLKRMGKTIFMAVLLIITISSILVAGAFFAGSFDPESKSKTAYDFSRDIDAQISINLLKLGAVKNYETSIQKANEVLEPSSQKSSIISILKGNMSKLESSLEYYYDAKAGFQILLNDAIVLQQIERLSYAFLYPEWTPTYDYNKTMDKELKEIQEKIKNDKSYKEMSEYLDKELEISKLRVTYNKYNEIIGKITSHLNSYRVEDGVYEYKKNIYGEETSDILKPDISMHSIVNTEVKYEAGYYEDDEVRNLFAKSIDLRGNKEVKKTTVPLSSLEFAYRLNYRRIHMDATFKNINDEEEIIEKKFEEEDEVLEKEVEIEAKKLENEEEEVVDRSKTLENMLTDKEKFVDWIIDVISMRLPIFQYVTSSSDTIGRTFYWYDLYDSLAFDERGNRSFTEIERAKIKKNILTLATAKKYNISFMDVLSGTLPEDEYKNNYDKLENTLLYRENEGLIFEPKNHEIIVKNGVDDDHYILYNGEYVDSYLEDILVSQDTTTGKITAKVTVSYKKSSLKPTSIRTNEADIDYIYSKKESRMTYNEVLAKLENERSKNPGNSVVKVNVRNYGEVLYSIASKTYTINGDELEEKVLVNEAKDFSPSKSNFNNPLKDGAIATNNFGVSDNTGIEIFAREGEKVKAVSDGMVVEKKDLGSTSYGKYVIIKHDNGLYTLYGNLKSYDKIKSGQKIKKGDEVGTVGKGKNGAYLYFEVRTANSVSNAICPIPYLHLENAESHKDCLDLSVQKYGCSKNSDNGYTSDYVLGE